MLTHAGSELSQRQGGKEVVQLIRREAQGMLVDYQNPGHGQQQVLARMWSHQNPHSLMVRMRNSMATIEHSLLDSLAELKVISPADLVLVCPDVYLEEKSDIHTDADDSFMHSRQNLKVKCLQQVTE